MNNEVLQYRNLRPWLIPVSTCGRRGRASTGLMASSCSVGVQLGLPILESTGEKCCNKGSSRSFCHSFYKHQTGGIGRAYFRQTGLFRGQHVLVKAALGRKTMKRETVIPSPDYRLSVVLLGIAGALTYNDNLLLAAPIGLLGSLLFVQTTRVRFVFDDEALEVRVGDQLEESGENAFVGGKNRWKYSTFLNWEFWWPNFPVLVYFKERQTKPEGQVHFFPVIFNGKQLYDVMAERAGSSKNSGPI